MARNTVEIDEDVFIDMLWERVNETRWGSKYSEDFWTEVFYYLSENSNTIIIDKIIDKRNNNINISNNINIIK